MLELPDDTELNDLVIMSIFLTNGDFIIISYIYIPINFNLSF